MKKMLALLVGFALAIFTSGCELSGGGGDSGDGGGSGPDDLDISNATTLDHNQIPAQNAAITRQLYTADKSGDHVGMDFETLNWPRQGKVDGGVYLYWRDGAGNVVGGLFDFHGTGQTVKGLVNVYGGYLGGKRPPKGAEIYFCIVNLKGTERTNVRKSVNNW
jgi:hypothetical protein